MAIKPIETRYAGYRFRSRLEARWAVFFDALNLEWKYEPEGFDLNGLPYLPDFFIKSWNCYAEIKPDVSDEVNRADEICQRFTTNTRKSITLFVGLPDDLRAVVYESGMWTNCPQAYVRTPISLDKLDGFELAALAAKSARFEHGESPAQRNA
jgi:hypothetical protein